VLGRLRRAARGGGDGSSPPPAGIELVSPLVVPGVTGAGLAARLNRRLAARALLPRLQAGPRPRILWIYTPTRLAIDLIGGLGEDLVVYHCTQSQAHRPGAPRNVVSLERELISRADVVVTDAIELYRERAPLHPLVYRVPSGVNPDQHAAAAPPAWLTGRPRPVLGYLGTVDHRVDLRLVAALARAMPEATVAVVGPVTDVSVEDLAGLGNVVLHGQVPREEVAGVLAAFDVGLMPYADRPLTRYTYPAKLHQYLAAGLPIASTAMPDLDEVGDLAEQAPPRPAEFVDAVRRALAAPARAEERRALAARNTWASRIEGLSAIVEGCLAGDPLPPGPEPPGA
jgi:UDP-galactopyranose mutase